MVMTAGGMWNIISEISSLAVTASTKTMSAISGTKDSNSAATAISVNVQFVEADHRDSR